MKKAKIISISILSSLLLLCFMDFTVAAPPSYVGIRTGETYTWKLSVAADNLNTTGTALFGDNWTYMFEYFTELWENATYCPFDFFQGTGLRFVLTNVSDEITTPYYMGAYKASGIYFDEYISYCNNNYTLEYNSSGTTDPMMYVMDPSYLNSTNWMYYMGYGTPVFTSVGLNWVAIASYWQAHTLTSPYTAGNVTITPLSNGLKIDLTDEYLEWLLYMMGGDDLLVGSLSDAELTATWNLKGIFSRGVIEYGDVELVTAYLVEEEEPIPGYEFSIFMGITAATILGLIYAVKKKKK